MSETTPVLVPGISGTATRTVTPDQTAEAFGSGLVPVFATPAMVGLMEQAAVVALAPYLGPDQTSVGTSLTVSHLAATPRGDRVRAEAELVAVEGRTLTFVVKAYDSAELIGEGRHDRVVVARERFLARVAAKAERLGL
jgi:predicted thioesterase